MDVYWVKELSEEGIVMRKINLTMILVVLASLGAFAALAGDKKVEYNKLSAEEQRVILHKGTEMPFTGEYETNWKKGTYVCRRCNAALYSADSKFDARCGWPSFDQELKGAVRREMDADGRRTEILCANCDGHLGHVFLGEGFTKKDTRHCVNSVSMSFVPEGQELPAVIKPSD